MYEIYIIAILLIVDIFLILASKIPLLNFIVGVISFGVGVQSLSVPDLPFTNLLCLLVIMLGIITILAGVIKLRSGSD